MIRLGIVVESKVSCSNPTVCLDGLGEPTSLQSSWWSLAQNLTQWLTSSEWCYLFYDGPKLVVGEPNSTLKKRTDIWPPRFFHHDERYPPLGCVRDYIILWA